jgi:hypothetical protein
MQFAAPASRRMVLGTNRLEFGAKRLRRTAKIASCLQKEENYVQQSSPVI